MKTAAERFWAKVDKRGPKDCWNWKASRSTAGYGRFGLNGRNTYAHRFSYGPVPSGLFLDHLCRNRACVNPAHLEAVTGVENIRRGNAGMTNRLKKACPRGHPYDGFEFGQRICRTCKRAAAKKWEARNRPTGFKRIGA